MNKNWQDQFELQDEGINHKAKKNNDKKKNMNTNTNTNNYQFQDLDGDDKNVKLPTITSKVVATDSSNKNINKINLQEITNKKENKGRLIEMELFDQPLEQSLAPLTSPVKTNKLKPNQQKAKANTSTLKEKQVEENPDDYGDQQFEQADYGDDFQIHEEKKASPVIYKPKEQKQQVIKKNNNTINIPKAVQKNRRGAESVMRINQNSVRAYTRTSARSQDKSMNSRSKVDQKKQEPPNKYTNMADKNCPNYEKKILEDFNMDKLVRQNQKIRNTIKKFNDQLNDMINKNILLLKGKKQEKVVDQEQVIKQLQELKNSNQTALQTTIRELSKLKGKEGALKEEQYHLTLDQKLQQTKNIITEIGKTITKLNFEISNQGNKLSKKDKDSKQANSNTEMSTVKMNLINIRKDEEKNEQTNKKLDDKLDELNKKTVQIQKIFNQQVEQAKTKGIVLAKNPQLIKKLEQVKKKIDIGRQHKGKTQALYKTKADMIQRQLQQIKDQIKNVQNNTINCRNSCEDIQEQSRKVVQKAKKTGKISQDLISSLQNILNEMQKGMILSRENNQQQSTFSHPKGAKKYQSQKNVEKVIPVSVTQRQAEKTQDDLNIKKPMLFKKKKQQQDQKHQERVWKDDKNNSPPKTDKNKESQAHLAKFENKQSQRKDQQKKKPFAFKKNKDKTNDQEPKAQSPKPQIKEIKKEEPKIEQPKKDEQEVPNLAPRMMRFKKNKQEPPKLEIKIPTPNEKTLESAPNLSKGTQNTPLKIQQKTEIEEPVIVPKRFNLKLKDRKTQETSYVATNMDRKEQTKIEQPKKVDLSSDNQKFSIKQPEKPIQAKAQTTQEKSYFNLKLKNRQKQTNRQQQKVEQKIQIKKQASQPIKIPITLSDNPNPMKENNNPYVQQEGVKRQKEGPIRKQKAQQNVPKQQFSIFQQAGDLEI